MISLLQSSYRLPDNRKRILFVCSGNACRGQIAEGWPTKGNTMKHYFSDPVMY